MLTTICPSCGAERVGLFCAHCGEKVPVSQEKTLAHFLGKIIAALTFADTKMLRTLFTIIKKPGTLSFDFARGKRNVYTPPISLFFIGNLLYFLFPVMQTFNTNLQTQVNHMPYSKMTEKALEQRLTERDISYENYEKKFNQKSTSNAKLLLISLVLFMTLGYMIICRNKAHVFGDHLIMSLELNIYNLFVTTFFITLLTILLYNIFHMLGGDLQPYLNDTVFTVLSIICMLYFFFFSQKKMYNKGNLLAFLSSVLLIIWFGFCLQLYRFELFWFTFWTT